jgi:AraC-like DNA-binding protein
MTGQNRVKVWRMPDLHDAEMLKGDYLNHAYPWHAHAEMSLGLVMEGAVSLRTRTRDGIAREGSFVLINAEEPHQGASVTSLGWRCRTIHIAPEIIEATARELGLPRRAGRPLFCSPTFDDAELARDLHNLHRGSENGGASLQLQSGLLGLIGKLLERHSQAPRGVTGNAAEPIAVRRARAYLDDNLSDKVTLEALSIAAGLTPFRLLRAFQHAVGMTPHAYHTQARVRAVRSLLATNTSLAEAAIAAGFADQAHLTRVFRSIMGATPGQYRAALGSTKN